MKIDCDEQVGDLYSRLAITGVIRTIFDETPEQFDPRKYLGPAREAMEGE